MLRNIYCVHKHLKSLLADCFPTCNTQQALYRQLVIKEGGEGEQYRKRFKNVIGNVIRSINGLILPTAGAQTRSKQSSSQSHLINEISSNLFPPPFNPPARATIPLHKSLN